VTTKSDRRAAREAVAAYHEEQLGELIRHVERAVERFRTGELNSFEVDELLFQYSRAAKELWKFCTLGNIEIAAQMIRDEPLGGWWERGARRVR
jgi:hypothetical protein